MQASMAREEKIEEMIRADLGFFTEVGEPWSALPQFVLPEEEALRYDEVDDDAELDCPPPGCMLLQEAPVLQQQDVLSRSEHSGVQSGQVHFECDGAEGITLVRRCSDPFPRVSEVEALKLEVKALERKLEHQKQLKAAGKRRVVRVAEGLEQQLMQQHDVDAPPSLSPAERIEAELIAKYGSLPSAARVKAGCLDLQRAIEGATQAHLTGMARQLLPAVPALASDFFGNYVVQCLIKNSANPAVLEDLCTTLGPELGALGKTQTGTRVVQTLLGKTSTQGQRDAISRGLVPCLALLSVDPVGTYVVQKAVEVLPPSHLAYLMVGLQGQLANVAQNKNGACAVRACVKRAVGPVRTAVLRELCYYSKALSMHAYGNYVIQAALEGEAEELSTALAPHVLVLACDKHGSNVVESLLKKQTSSTPTMLSAVVVNAAALATDTFGNFVVQTAVSQADPQQFAAISAALHPVLGQLSQFKQGRTLLQLLQTRASSRSP